MDRFRWISTPTAGEAFTGVVLAKHVYEEGITECEILGTELTVMAHLMLQTGHRYTLYFYKVDADGSLSHTPESVLVHLAEATQHSFGEVKELCAGIGGIGLGLAAGGAKVIAAMDINALAIRHLQMNFSFPAFCGNITSDKDLCTLHLAGHVGPTLEAAGFPCQPFSQQGDGRAFDDQQPDQPAAQTASTISISG